MNARVLVAHPGSSPLVYELAAAVPNLGWDGQFETGFYFDPQGTLAGLVARLPAGVRAKLTRELTRRTLAAIDPARVTTHPFWELMFVAAARAFPTRPGWSSAIMHHRNRRFDEAVAGRIARERTAVLIGHDTSTLRSLRAAKAAGTVGILNQVIGHLAVGRRTLREEAALHPEFADSLHADAPDWLVDQCLAEAREADLVLAPSPYVRDTLIEVGVAPGKVRLVPYGVRVDRFRPPDRPRDDGLFRIVYVGQLSQRKGLKYLLDAVGRMGGAGVELVLVGGIVGEGRGFRAYDGTFRHVRNVPHAEVAALYQSADICAYPSLHEGSALAILEAMACGLPIVTTPNAGSLVRDGVDGLMVPIRDVDQLAAAIEALRADPDRRRAMGQAARARALEFTWDAYRANLGAVLAEVAGKP